MAALSISSGHTNTPALKKYMHLVKAPSVLPPTYTFWSLVITVTGSHWLVTKIYLAQDLASHVFGYYLVSYQILSILHIWLAKSKVRFFFLPNYGLPNL